MSNQIELAEALCDWLRANETAAEHVIAWRYDTLKNVVEVHIRNDFFFGNLIARYPQKLTEKLGVLGNRHFYLNNGPLVFTTVLQASKIDAAV